MKHLRYDLRGAFESGLKMHPSVDIINLGIKGYIWYPQTICDEIWLLDCKAIPEVLPNYIRELEDNCGDIEEIVRSYQ